MAKKLYVGNMSYNTDQESLRALFAQFGEVSSVNLITDRYTGQSKGFAFVEMQSDEAASAAIAGVNGKEVDGRQLKVDEARDRQGGDDRNRFRGGRRY